MLRRVGLAQLVMGLGLLAAPACTPSDPGQTLFRAGASGVSACAPCHDPAQATDAIPGKPRLAGQQSSYLIKSLKAFRSGERTNPAMSPAAVDLSDQQITDVAAYLSRLKAPHRPGRDHLTPDQAARAASIFAAGLPGQGVPACAGCHGPRGAGSDSAPMIAAQDSIYAAARMHAFASGPAGPMHDIAVKLGPDDSDLMATYLSTLRPEAVAQ